MKQVNVDINNNLLIIGPADTAYGLLDINYESSIKEVQSKYGASSELTKAFEVAKKFNVEHIFLMNIRDPDDLLNSSDILLQNDFAYIVCTNVLLSDSYRDQLNSNIEHSYYANLLGRIGQNHNSVFVVTNKHASLYETIDDFLDDLHYYGMQFKRRCSMRANLENIIIVANNLKEYPLANVVVASLLASTPIYEYPLSDQFGDAIFSIDHFDDVYDYAYFKNHTWRETTLDNLLNAFPTGYQKIVTISRILKYVKRSLDFSEFKGRLYTKYILLQISKKLDYYLKNLLNIAIIDYQIISVEAVNGEVPGTVDIECKYEIVPINSLERCQLEKRITL